MGALFHVVTAKQPLVLGLPRYMAYYAPGGGKNKQVVLWCSLLVQCAPGEKLQCNSVAECKLLSRPWACAAVCARPTQTLIYYNAHVLIGVGLVVRVRVECVVAIRGPTGTRRPADRSRLSTSRSRRCSACSVATITRGASWASKKARKHTHALTFAICPLLLAGGRRLPQEPRGHGQGLQGDDLQAHLLLDWHRAATQPQSAPPQRPSQKGRHTAGLRTTT